MSGKIDSNDPLLDFNGKVALITGAASGFGQALSIELAKRGANLAIADFNEAGLAETAAQCSEFGAEVAHIVGDISDESHVKALCDLAGERFGRIDIAVNNAGIAPKMQSIAQLTESDIDKQLAVNVKGVAFGLKYQTQMMAAKGGGAILNVSSMAGIGGAPLASTYSAAKHAVIGLTRTAAVEFAKMNVRVNAVCPFFTLTPMVNNPILNPNNNVEDLNNSIARTSPMKRVAEVDEVIGVMVMMLSPKNTFMTGISVPVDGGMSAM